jgi:hypothetical protein
MKSRLQLVSWAARWLGGALCLGLGVASVCQADETLVFVRHGEKPQGGYGQLNCQGLNRALALPGVLARKFGKPAAIFAPDPTGKVPDAAGKFYYVRPLVTIEPTAIRLGMPLQTPYGVTNLSGVQAALTTPELANAVVYVAWEHIWLVNIAKSVVKIYGGNPDSVPAWPDDDYDSIYVLKLSRHDGKPAVSFTHDHEGLNGRSSSCPGG